MKVSGNTVLITGGSSGVGLELAKKFLSEGNTVIITGRSLEKLQAVKNKYPEIIIESANITSEEDSIKLAKKYDINILINNAGVQYQYDICSEHANIKIIKQEIDTNFTGQVVLTRVFLPTLLTKDDAAIINITSLLGIVPKESATVYCATKSAFRSFTKSLRWQLSCSSIKVFEIVPPLVATAMTDENKGKKISPQKLVNDFWRNFKKDKYTVFIGKSKAAYYINRMFPSLAERVIRKG